MPRQGHVRRSGRGGQFRSRNEAMNRRIQCWVCAICDSRFTSKPNDRYPCPQCDAPPQFYYFPSKAEANRYAQLRLMEKGGVINNLRLQPIFPIKFNGIKICEYRADFQYMRKGKIVFEDVKPSNFMTELAKFKIRIVEVMYGISITIVSPR